MENPPKETKYHDLILYDVQFHGNRPTNPKGWYSQTIGAAMSPKETRAYTYDSKFSQDSDGKWILQLNFPMGKEEVDKYSQAVKDGKQVRLLYPKKGILIHNAQSLTERIGAENKRLGFEKFKDLQECRAVPLGPPAIDTEQGRVTIKLVLM